MQNSTSFLNFRKKAFYMVLGSMLAVLSATAQQYTSTNPPPAFPPSNVDRTMDRDQMCYQLGITFPSLPPKDKDPNRPPDAYAPNGIDNDWTDSLGTGNTIVRGGFGLWNNYHDEKVGVYSPIDLLKMKDGTKVTTPEQWWNLRRPEIEKDVHEQVWGVFPADSILPKVTWTVVVTNGGSGSGAYIQKEITGTIDISRYPQVRNVPKITATLRTPANAQGKVPVIIEIYGDAASYYSTTSAAGWGVCAFKNEDLQPDNGSGLTSYLVGLVNKGNWRKPSDWGAIGAWTWGISKLIDYLETDPNVDATRVGVSGHSRYGKTTIAAMAFDKRIFIAYPSCAGSLGYKLFRRNFGQTIENHSWDQEYHWVAGNLFKWMGPLNEGQYMPRKLENCPVDGHSLLSLCAPRPVFGNSGNKGDTWQDYYGAFLSMRATSPVYELLGKKGLVSNDVKPILDSAYNQGDLAFRWHNEGHTDSPDWPAFFRFASKYIKVPYLNYTTTGFSVTDTSKSASFTVSSDTTWTVTGPSWLTFSPASGRLNGKINVAIARNLTNAERIDTIRLNAPGLYEQKIVIKQAAQVLTVSPGIVVVAGAANSTAQFTIVSDTTWTISVVSSTPWISADKTSGKNNGTITLTAQENTGAIRSDTIKIEAPGLTVKKVAINQGVSSGTMTATIDATDFTVASGKDTVRITSNNVWSATSSQSWAALNAAGGMNDGKVGILIAANTGVSSRTATITIKSPGVADKEFTINQAGIVPTKNILDLSNFSYPTSLNISGKAYSTGNIWFGSNATAFTVSSTDPSWLTVSGGNGTPFNFYGTNWLIPTISASANTSLGSRTANIVMSFPGSSTTFTLPVTQAGKAPEVVLSKDFSMLSEIAQNDTTFLTAEDTWTATKSQAWLTLKKTSGHVGADTLAISVAANAGSTVLIDTVKVYATGNAVAKYFVVRQQPAGVTLTLSKTTSNLAATVNSKDSVKITSTGAWGVSCSESWLKLNVNSGSGTKYVVFTADQNPNTPDSRSATITVSAAGLTDKTIVVTQASAAPTLVVSESEVSLASWSATVPITITSNVKWTIKSSHTFVEPAVTAGSNNAMVLLKVAQNPFSPVRIATITITGDGGLTKTIKLTQASAPASLYVLPLETDFKAELDSVYMLVNTNSTFTLSKADNWITVTPTTNANNNSQVMAKVTASANPTPEERTAIVKVSVPGLQVQSFTYIQAAGPATLNLSKVTIEAIAAGSSETFDIASNSSWTITSSESWVVPYPASGNYNTLVTLGIQKNATTAARTATVTVTVNGLAPQTITVNQAASATGIDDAEEADIKVYPNPVVNKLSIKLNGKPSSINITGVEGQELYNRSTEEPLVDIDFSGYKPGVYLINIKVDGKVIKKKVVKL